MHEDKKAPSLKQRAERENLLKCLLSVSPIAYSLIPYSLIRDNPFLSTAKYWFSSCPSCSSWFHLLLNLKEPLLELRLVLVARH